MLRCSSRSLLCPHRAVLLLECCARPTRSPTAPPLARNAPPCTHRTPLYVASSTPDSRHAHRQPDRQGSSTTAWRARLVLFCGFALLAGGLAGSIVRLLLLGALDLFRVVLVMGGRSDVRPSH
jgi:hypothetical protein